MARRKGKSSGPPDRTGGIAKAWLAARRGASERAAERAAAVDGPESQAPDARADDRAEDRRSAGKDD